MHLPRKNVAIGHGTVAASAVRRRLPLFIASLAAALALSGCGGGGDGEGSGYFNVGIVIGGQSTGATPVVSGGSVSVVVRAGQTLRVDAGERVVWTMYVGGSAVAADGVLVRYAGAEIAPTVVSGSAIEVDTYAPGFLSNAVPFTLVATSTYDSAQVVTAYVSIVN